MNIVEFLKTLTSLDDHIAALNTIKFLTDNNLLKDMPHTMKAITNEINGHADKILGEMERYFYSD